uniref:Uncharacterized protein n=1 Tax=Oncorhynchus kisutch TaxID=8019 RepID=A0A8C7JHH8_ONCKI
MTPTEVYVNFRLQLYLSYSVHLSLVLSSPFPIYSSPSHLLSPEELVESSSDKETAGSEENSPGSVIDVEDLGNILNGIKKAKEDGQIVKLSRLNGMMKAEEKEERRELIAAALREALTVTGFPSFYGVESHRCMESTLSLVCANKCDFCWSWVHHTNPVDTEWQAVENHQNMFRQRRKPKCFSPAVSHTDFSLALSHCDLSLTIPLFSFSPCLPIPSPSLALIPVSYSSLTSSPPGLVLVTKLYVSVGAGTKGSLKKIDRLLFNDFWPRFLDSLKDLGEKVSTSSTLPSFIICLLHFNYTVIGFTPLADINEWQFSTFITL